MGNYNFTYELPCDFVKRIKRNLEGKNLNELTKIITKSKFEIELLDYAYP